MAELRAALKHERRMRAAEVAAAERRGRVAAEATGQHRVLPGLLGWCCQGYSDEVVDNQLRSCLARRVGGRTAWAVAEQCDDGVPPCV